MTSISDKGSTPPLPKDTTTAESKQKATKELEFFKKQLPLITKDSENLPEKMDSLINFASDKPNLNVQIRKMKNCGQILSTISKDAQGVRDYRQVTGLLDTMKSTWNEVKKSNPEIISQHKDVDDFVSHLTNRLVDETAPKRPTPPPRPGRIPSPNVQTTTKPKTQLPLRETVVPNSVTNQPANYKTAEFVLKELQDKNAAYRKQFYTFKRFVQNLPASETKKFESLIAAYDKVLTSIDHFDNALSTASRKPDAAEKANQLIKLLRSPEFNTLMNDMLDYAKEYSKHISVISQIDKQKLPAVEALKSQYKYMDLDTELIVPVQLPARFPLYLQQLIKALPAQSTQLSVVKDNIDRTIKELQDQIPIRSPEPKNVPPPTTTETQPKKKRFGLF